MDHVLIAIYFVGFLYWFKCWFSWLNDDGKDGYTISENVFAVFCLSVPTYLIFIGLTYLVAYGFMWVKSALA